MEAKCILSLYLKSMICVIDGWYCYVNGWHLIKRLYLIVEYGTVAPVPSHSEHKPITQPWKRLLLCFSSRAVPFSMMGRRKKACKWYEFCQCSQCRLALRNERYFCLLFLSCFLRGYLKSLSVYLSVDSLSNYWNAWILINIVWNNHLM